MPLELESDEPMLASATLGSVVSACPVVPVVVPPLDVPLPDPVGTSKPVPTTASSLHASGTPKARPPTRARRSVGRIPG